jgi:predicted enzyme related to lactoylglutathione lyase
VDHTIVHFEIPADDPERAIAFYREVFGWQIHKDPHMDYWMLHTVATGPDRIPTSPGSNGGLMKKMYPGQGVTNYFGVEDAEAAGKKIEAAGGVILVPKQHVPGHGYFVQFKDPEGNVMAVWEAEMKPA